jgi:hypothetical protein
MLCKERVSVCVIAHHTLSPNVNKSRGLRQDEAHTVSANCCVAAEIGGRLREL